MMASQTKPTPSPSRAEEGPDLPTRVETKTVFLGGIFLLMLLAALHTACDIAIPFILALMLKFVFHPVIRRCTNWGMPRALASILVIALLLGGLVGIGAALSGPATAWSSKIADSYPQLEQRLDFLRKPFMKTQKMLRQADTLTDAAPSKKVIAVVEGPNVSDKIIGGTQALAGGMFTTLLILLFMLTAGDTFLRRFVEILPRYHDKRQAVDIAHEIEHDISRYLLTITAMNLCVGVAAGFGMWVAGVDDPILWGALAFLLNYIPIVGPFTGIGIFFLVGIMSVPDSWMAFLPAVAYLMIHIAEGTFITPMLLARRFTLNPVLVIMSLIFWYWMWGITGAILAMPMLAILKIICDRLERLTAFGHFLEG
jgi:predicted PurR-regulated permease PerM